MSHYKPKVRQTTLTEAFLIGTIFGGISMLVLIAAFPV